MRRALAVLSALALLSACSSAGHATPTPTPTVVTTTSTATTATPTIPPSASPNGTGSPSPSPSVDQEDVHVPADMRTTISDGMDLARIDAGDLSPLVPPGSNVGDRQILTTAGDPSEEIALTWERGDDPFAAEHGFVVWRRAADAWTAVYAFTDRVKTGVLGLGPLRSGDLTGDGLPEIVTLEQQGGSGACGVTRVISTTGGDAREIYRSSGCDRTIDVVGDHLEVREAVFGPDDPHCCPSSFRVTTLAWDGSRFRETSTTTEPAPR